MKGVQNLVLGKQSKKIDNSFNNITMTTVPVETVQQQERIIRKIALQKKFENDYDNTAKETLSEMLRNADLKPSIRDYEDDLYDHLYIKDKTLLKPSKYHGINSIKRDKTPSIHKNIRLKTFRLNNIWRHLVNKRGKRRRGSMVKAIVKSINKFYQYTKHRKS